MRCWCSQENAGACQRPILMAFLPIFKGRTCLAMPSTLDRMYLASVMGEFGTCDGRIQVAVLNAYDLEVHVDYLGSISTIRQIGGVVTTSCIGPYASSLNTAGVVGFRIDVEQALADAQWTSSCLIRIKYYSSSSVIPQLFANFALGGYSGLDYGNSPYVGACETPGWGGGRVMTVYDTMYASIV